MSATRLWWRSRRSRDSTGLGASVRPGVLRAAGTSPRVALSPSAVCGGDTVVVVMSLARTCLMRCGGGWGPAGDGRETARGARFRPEQTASFVPSTTEGLNYHRVRGLGCLAPGQGGRAARSDAAVGDAP